MIFREKYSNYITFGDFFSHFPVSEWLCRKALQYDIKDKEFLLENLQRDIQWIAKNDPAAKNNSEYVDSCYVGALALASYRLSNYLYQIFGLVSEAENIAYETYRITSIYIHPNSKIGCPVSIDHGYKTFIGDNCEIGDRCIILNGVKILPLIKEARLDVCSGSKIKIGSDVVICANTVISGTQNIGDGVFLKPFTFLKSEHEKVITA